MKNGEVQQLKIWIFVWEEISTKSKIKAQGANQNLDVGKI